MLYDGTLTSVRLIVARRSFRGKSRAGRRRTAFGTVITRKRHIVVRKSLAAVVSTRVRRVVTGRAVSTRSRRAFDRIADRSRRSALSANLEKINNIIISLSLAFSLSYLPRPRCLFHATQNQSNKYPGCRSYLFLSPSLFLLSRIFF